MKNIVILGAGFGSVALLRSLQKAYHSKANFTLVSEHDFHYQTTLLHKAAAKAPGLIRYELDKVLFPELKYKIAKVLKINLDSVELEDGSSLEFDHLVIGLGSSKNLFGIPGMEDAYEIGNWNNAQNTAEKIYAALKNPQSELDKSVLVCGGGLSGVEFASELAQMTKRQGLAIDIKVIEALPRILPIFRENNSAYAKEKLGQMGVLVMDNTKILRKEGNCLTVQTANGEEKLESNFIVWTAGVRGNDVIAASTDFVSGNNRIEIDDYMRPVQFANDEARKNKYFVLGDISCKKGADGRFNPPTAQIAMQQGQYFAGVLERIIDGKNDLGTGFMYEYRGTVCSLGDDCGVGEMGAKDVSGRYGSWIKDFIDKKWKAKVLGFCGWFK